MRPKPLWMRRFAPKDTLDERFCPQNLSGWEFLPLKPSFALQRHWVEVLSPRPLWMGGFAPQASLDEKFFPQSHSGSWQVSPTSSSELLPLGSAGAGASFTFPLFHPNLFFRILTIFWPKCQNLGLPTQAVLWIFCPQTLLCLSFPLCKTRLSSEPTIRPRSKPGFAVTVLDFFFLPPPGFSFPPAPFAAFPIN